MNNRLFLVAAPMMAVQLLAAQEKPAPFALNVYIEGVAMIPLPILRPAEGIASKMLAEAGVRLVWYHRRPKRR